MPSKLQRCSPRRTRSPGRATRQPTRRAGACTTTTRRRTTACAARCIARGPQSGVVWQHGPRGRRLGRARARRPDLQRRQDLPGPARRPGARPGPAARRGRAGRRARARHRLRRRRTTAPSPGTTCCTQTSEWEGNCFGLPDTVDRWRKVAHDPRPAGGPQGRRAAAAARRAATGNTTTCASTSCRWRCCTCSAGRCPRCSSSSILRPLGGGDGFAWGGYDDAWVELPGGRRVQSVPGGTHWGGGVSISARDQARIGQLLLDGGAARAGSWSRARWARSACASPAPSRRSTAAWCGSIPTAAPSPARRRRRSSCSAPAAMTCGSTRHLDAVVVLRWLDPAHAPGVIRRLASALTDIATRKQST